MSYWKKSMMNRRPCCSYLAKYSLPQGIISKIQRYITPNENLLGICAYEQKEYRESYYQTSVLG